MSASGHKYRDGEVLSQVCLHLTKVCFFKDLTPKFKAHFQKSEFVMYKQPLKLLTNRCKLKLPAQTGYDILLIIIKIIR